MSIATHIIDITGGTVHTVDTLLAAAVPSGSSLVTILNAQLGSTVWQGGGSGTPSWGSIVGTLSSQTDLQAALNAKAASSHTHTLSQITDITVSTDMVEIPKGIRPGLYDETDSPPVGTLLESVNDGHLYWIHRDGSVHLLCDSGGYGGGSTNWGDIAGTLADQGDLQTALDGKQDSDAILSALVSIFSAAANVIPVSISAGSVGGISVPSYFQTVMNSANAATAQAALDLLPGTDVQPFSGNLDAIAGLTTSADKVVCFTGSETAILKTVTTAGWNLLDDTSTSAMRTTLGVAIGTNVQAYSSRLTTFETILVTPLASASQAAVAGTAGASYTSTEQALINDLKTLVNQLRADLITARIIKGSA